METQCIILSFTVRKKREKILRQKKIRKGNQEKTVRQEIISSLLDSLVKYLTSQDTKAITKK